MSLRDKLLFFGIIVALFLIVLFGFIFPAEEILKTENQFIELKSPAVACSTLENFNNMISFSKNKDYASAENYLQTKKCERLESGTVVKVIDSTLPDTLVVKPNDRSIHLYVSSAIAGN